ncbi:hypothetical protein L6R53_07030 [Myxococcota bacterium]|nr:hypothetical protein [Myxococcota bacterium]
MSQLALSLTLLLSGCGTEVITPGGDGGADDTGGGTDTAPPPRDDDGDGWFTPEDCNDFDEQIHPDATEVCDGRDNDCDGIVDVNDAVDASPFFMDGDGDGYGDPSVGLSACGQPPGFVTDGTDCDDDDPATHPGAPEICNDGADNNCNDDALECALSGDLSLSAAQGIWSGQAGGDQAGFALAGAGDVDGDGRDDVLVGGPNHDANGNADAGAAWLVGGAVALQTSSLAAATATWQGTVRSDNAGVALAGVGDLDGDGYDDLLVGAYHSDLGSADSGAAYLVMGPTSGVHLLGTADALLVGELSYDLAGLGVGGGQDLTGDGVGDLLVGASGQGEGSVQSRGRAYVVAGVPTGTVDLSTAGAWVDGQSSYDRVSRVVSLPDATGDGIADLAVGAYTWSDNDGRGAVFLFAGPLVGALTTAEADVTLEGEAEDGQAGYALASAGDVDGDGATDLLVGAPYAEGGADESGIAYLVLGPSASGPLSGADVRFVGDEARADLGAAVAGGGDFDGDGRADVLLGAPAADTNSTDSGGAWLFYAPSSGSLTPADADLRLVAENARDEAGTAVAFAGNVDGDCCDDVLVGAVEADRGGSGSGVAYIVLGQGL